MIENDHQRRITESWVQRFSISLEAILTLPDDRPERWLVELNESAIRSQLGSLQAELTEYDALRGYSEGRSVLT